VKFRSCFRTLATELPTRSTACSNSSRVTPKCFIQYLTSISLVTVILLRSGITLFVTLRRTSFSIVLRFARSWRAAFHDRRYHRSRIFFAACLETVVAGMRSCRPPNRTACASSDAPRISVYRDNGRSMVRSKRPDQFFPRHRGGCARPRAVSLE
jgi:hypothetical protein